MVGTEVCLPRRRARQPLPRVLVSEDAARTLPEMTLGDLFAEWDVAGRRVPVEGVLEPTFRCNLRCVHCYVNQPAGSAEEQARELGTERSLALIDEMAEAGCLNLLMTGGEVLLRPDFERALPARARPRPAGHRLHERHPRHRPGGGPLRPPPSAAGRDQPLRHDPRDLRARHRRARARTSAASRASAGCTRAACRSRSRRWPWPGTATRSRPCGASRRELRRAASATTAC